MSINTQAKLPVDMEIKDARNLSPKELTALRERAVKAVLDGRSRVEVAEDAGIYAASLTGATGFSF